MWNGDLRKLHNKNKFQNRKQTTTYPYIATIIIKCKKMKLIKPQNGQIA